MDIGNKIALFGDRINLAFGDYLGIGILNSDGAYAQIFGKISFGRQFLSHREIPA